MYALWILSGFPMRIKKCTKRFYICFEVFMYKAKDRCLAFWTELDFIIIFFFLLFQAIDSMPLHTRLHGAEPSCTVYWEINA